MCGKAFLTVTDTTISSGGCRASFCWSSTLWFRLTRQLYKTITVLHHPQLICFKAFEHILYLAAFTDTYPLIRIQLDAGQMFCGNRLGKIMWTCIRQYSEKHDWHVIIHHMQDVDLILYLRMELNTLIQLFLSMPTVSSSGLWQVHFCCCLPEIALWLHRLGLTASETIAPAIQPTASLPQTSCAGKQINNFA